ncbi:hypothetical protein REPUB_Repub05bG0077300 [Reevesia pubescens]
MRATPNPCSEAVWCCPSVEGLNFNVDKSARGKPGPAVMVSLESKNVKAVQLFSSSKWMKTKPLTIESDSKIVISWVLNKSSRPWKEWKTFHEIDGLCKSIGAVQFVHTYREANNFVDSLAKMGVDQEDFICAFW